MSASPWTVTCQGPLSMGFPRQEYWSELPFPPPGTLDIIVIKIHYLLYLYRVAWLGWSGDTQTHHCAEWVTSSCTRSWIHKRLGCHRRSGTNRYLTNSLPISLFMWERSWVLSITGAPLTGMPDEYMVGKPNCRRVPKRIKSHCKQRRAMIQL